MPNFDDSPDINSGVDLSTLVAPPTQETDLGERPPSPSQLLRDKLLGELDSRQKEMSRVDDKGRNGYQRLIAQTLGDQDEFAAKRVGEKYGGKMGTAKAILVDFLSGVAKTPSDVKQAIRDKSLQDYQKASQDVIEQEKMSHQQAMEQVRLQHENVLSEKNDNVMKHYQDMADVMNKRADTDENYKKAKAETETVKAKALETKANSDKIYKDMIIGVKNKELETNKLKALKIGNATELAVEQADKAGLQRGTPEWLKKVDEVILMQQKAKYAYKPQASTITSFATDPKYTAMINREADKYNAGGKLPTGYGKEMGGLKLAVLQVAAERDPSGNLAKAEAEYLGTKQGLASIIKTKAQVESFARTASDSLGLVEDNSKKVARSGMPLYNHYLLWKNGKIDGDDDTALLQNSIDTATTEYARVMSGSMSGQTTDSLRNKAEGMLSAAMADHTVPKVIAQMKKEMEFRKNNFNIEVKTLSDSIGKNSSNKSTGKHYTMGANGKVTEVP